MVSPLQAPLRWRSLGPEKYSEERELTPSISNWVDGSGLARQNLITSSMTTSLLRYMRTHPNEATQRAFY